MNSEPLILVLEDERPQLLTLRATLEPLGRVTDFSDPLRALEFIQEQRVDAAVVDVHMPTMPINGIEFVRAVRKFDKDLSVIIRTGDASAELADEAIEVQAYRRAVKSKTSVRELRELTRAAIAETRSRRKLTRDAGSTAELSLQLEKTLGSIEDELSVAESYRGLIFGLRNQLTALTGFAETWSAVAARTDDRALAETAAENKRIADRMLADMAAFLEGPFAETPVPSLQIARADVNAALDALKRRFAATPAWAAERKSVEITLLKQSLVLAAHPLKLLTALRHAVEYCLTISSPGAHVVLAPRYTADLERTFDEIAEPNLVFNRPARRSPAGHVVFLVQTNSPKVGVTEVRQHFHQYPSDPRIGNPHMLTLALGEERCTIVVHLDRNGVLELHVCVPVGGASAPES